MGFALSEKWMEHFGLSYSQPPEFFQSSDEVLDVPHAGALRDAFDELGLSAVFCVQGVPTVAFLVQDQYDIEEVINTHAALWNQGLASLFLVITGDTFRAFSLARRTIQDSQEEFKNSCLIGTIGLLAELASKGLIYSVTSGRFWKENDKFFGSDERIDNVLLKNLSESHRLLQDKRLSSEQAQALLMQTMFIAYLEDRGIINENYFQEATKGKASQFESLLAAGDVKSLNHLFMSLRGTFNGDLFVAPCSLINSKNSPNLNGDHLSILARFRSGREEMFRHGSQLRFWGYDFRFIPVELISAVYDRFLGEKESVRRGKGAYYTPMFLADTVIAQVWDALEPSIKETGKFLDPACGSGVFLVRTFQLLCEWWRVAHPNQTIRWDSLCKLLERVHGWDINGNAVRVTAFSLYIALLEQIKVTGIQSLINHERILPELWGKTLVEQDFFKVDEKNEKYEVIIGNPPWISYQGSQRLSIKWCKEHNFPMPGKQEAWGFSWKALKHLTQNGVVAFLLPAMGFLHNHSRLAIDARKYFIRSTKILRIINFADLRFQLFQGATKPAILIIFNNTQTEQTPYRFEYWVPKADLNLRLKRFITLSSVDKTCLRSDEVEKNPLIFKHRLWMRTPETKLLHYLESFPKLKNFIDNYDEVRWETTSMSGRWVIGQGFQKLNPQNATSYHFSEFVTKYPFLDIEICSKLALPTISNKPRTTKKVRRKGFEAGFLGTRILVSKGFVSTRGVEIAQLRLRASYTEQNLCFTDALQGITVPDHKKDMAKFMTAIINSQLATWYFFHGISSFGVDLPNVRQKEFLYLPLPNIKDLPEPHRAKKAEKKLIKIMDQVIANKDELLASDDYEKTVLSKIDDLTYEYFCLSNDEITIIEDGVNYFIPAAQPHQGTFPKLWETISNNDRRIYTDSLKSSLEDWLEDRWAVNVSHEASNADLSILRLKLVPKEEESPYLDNPDNSVGDALKKLWQHGHHSMTGNFQLFPDFRIFIEGALYLVKPSQKRFWLRSSALSDADAIAIDLQDALSFENKSVQA